MITRTQCRMARGALGWSIRDLAREVGFSFNAIGSYELGQDCRASTLLKIERAFKSRGIVFAEDGLTVTAPAAREKELDRVA